MLSSTEIHFFANVFKVIISMLITSAIVLLPGNKFRNLRHYSTLPASQWSYPIEHRRVRT